MVGVCPQDRSVKGDVISSTLQGREYLKGSCGMCRWLERVIEVAGTTQASLGMSARLRSLRTASCPGGELAGWGQSQGLLGQLEGNSESRRISVGREHSRGVISGQSGLRIHAGSVRSPGRRELVH